MVIYGRSMKTPSLTVIIPLYDEAPVLQTLYERLSQATAAIDATWMFLFVDDGSRDTSYAILEELHRRDPRVQALRLSRNFGHQAALTAGLDVADTDAVILMDADLQHPPELIRSLVEAWRQGHDIVHTQRENVGSPWRLRAIASSLFYRLFRQLTGMDMGLNAADFRLLDKKVVLALRSMKERTRFLRGLTARAGFQVTVVPYNAPFRHSGTSKYSWPRMVRFALDGLVSFSAAPLYWAIYAGFALSAMGVLEIGYALIIHFYTSRALPGWTSLIIWISLIGGLQLLLMGISGIYIAKIYEEVKERPAYLIRERLL